MWNLRRKKKPQQTNKIKQKQIPGYREWIGGYQWGRGLRGGQNRWKTSASWWWLITGFIVVITLQCIQMLNYNAVLPETYNKKRIFSLDSFSYLYPSSKFSFDLSYPESLSLWLATPKHLHKCTSEDSSLCYPWETQLSQSMKALASLQKDTELVLHSHLNQDGESLFVLRWASPGPWIFDIQVNAVKFMLTKEVNDRTDEDFSVGSWGDHGGESRQRVCLY